jgi:hypothetical protein
VTYNGAPAVGAAVFLQRPGVDSPYEQTLMGVVQEDGSFSIDCGSVGKGAAPGEYAVLIKWEYDPKLAKAPPRTPRPDRLRNRFADPSHPRFHAVVKAETNLLPAFKLTDEDPTSPGGR